jgi:hypothetical protein
MSTDRPTYVDMPEEDRLRCEQAYVELFTEHEAELAELEDTDEVPWTSVVRNARLARARLAALRKSFIPPAARGPGHPARRPRASARRRRPHRRARAPSRLGDADPHERAPLRGGAQ